MALKLLLCLSVMALCIVTDKSMEKELSQKEDI